MTSVSHIDDFIGGWFVGNFAPTLLSNEYVEVCVKHFREGETEPEHYQLVATEITVIISGECLIAGHKLGSGDIITIAPREVAAFMALTDVSLVAVKSPSIPDDKALA